MVVLTENLRNNVKDLSVTMILTQCSFNQGICDLEGGMTPRLNAFQSKWSEKQGKKIALLPKIVDLFIYS